MRFYLETSALNYFAKKYEYQDAIASKNLQTEKGNQYYLSPVTIWEILLIKDKAQREKIIFYAQHIFNENLLASPSEILIDYIKKGCPPFQKVQSYNSKSNLGKIWTKICIEKETTFEYDDQSLNQITQELKTLSQIINKIIITPTLKIHLSKKDERINVMISDLYQNIFRDSETDLHTIRMRRLSILITFYYLCLGIDITNDVINQYWDSLNIKDPIQRLMYISTNYPMFFQSGPIWVITNMVYFQSIHRKKINRGAIHDGLHCVYLPIIQRFITNDIQFKELKSIATRPFYQNIFHLSELNITETKRSLVI